MDVTEFEAHLLQLRKDKQDNETVEVKSWGQIPKAKASQSLWDSVSAFANTGGGHIFLGLSEPDFNPVEGFDIGAAEQAVRAGLNDRDRDAQKVDPIPLHALHRLPVGNADVLVLTIEQLNINGPCFVRSQGIQKGSYKRVGDADRHLNALEVYELQHRFDQDRTDIAPVPHSSVEDLDPTSLEAFHRRLVTVQSLTVREDDDQWLRKKNITTASGEPTLAGLLSMGSYPQQFQPRICIDVAVHPGNQKSPLGTSVRFEDRIICEGNLLAMVQSALRGIKKNLRTRRVIEGHVGVDVLEIPEEVLREALANAVIHRDYSALALNESINVDIFKDRVEISSPGGLPGGKTRETIGDGHSIPRNATLARMLMDVPWTDGTPGVLAESNGTGVRRMRNLMHEAGLPTPEFDIDLARITVHLSRHGLLNPEVNAWIEDLLGKNFRSPQGIALVLAKELGAVSPGDLRRQTGHDSADMRGELLDLEARGILAETAPDRFVLASEIIKLTDSETLILEAIDMTVPTTIREISAATGRTANAIRPILRTLLEAELIEATAPPSSRNRAYLRRFRS